MTHYKDVKEHFERVGMTPKKKRYKARCKHCTRAGQSAKVASGRSSYYDSHLASCQYYLATLPPAQVPTQRDPAPPLRWTRATVKKFLSLLVAYQHRLRLPDTFIEYEETEDIFEFLCPGISCQLPSAKQLGGPILQEHGSRCQLQAESCMKAKCAETGGRMNMLADVWENISKEHVLLSRFELFGLEMTFKLEQVGAEHHGIAIASDLEKLLLKAQESGWPLVLSSRMTLVNVAEQGEYLALRWPKVAFVRCFTHDVNNLVKQVLNTVFRDVARRAAAVVNAINASSSKWLKHLRDLQKQEYGKRRALITFCLTRWNSMQGCFASLLRSKRALSILSVQHANSDGWPSSLKVLEHPEFWTQLVEAEKLIRPLSGASFRLQRAENSLADVVVSYAEIYRKFASTNDYGETLEKCVEKRWNTCEQPLFMLALYRHPVFGQKALGLPTTSVSGRSRIQHFGIYYYRRFVDENVTGVRESLNKWFDGQYTTIRPSDYDKPVPSFWTDLKREYPFCMLPVLALTVLSIAVSTATCGSLNSAIYTHPFGTR